MSELKGLVADIEAASFTADASIDLSWWNDTAVVFERAVILHLRCQNGFVAAGISPASDVTGARLVFMRPETWSRTQVRSHSTPPAGSDASAPPGLGSGAPSGSGSGAPPGSGSGMPPGSGAGAPSAAPGASPANPQLSSHSHCQVRVMSSAVVTAADLALVSNRLGEYVAIEKRGSKDVMYFHFERPAAEGKRPLGDGGKRVQVNATVHFSVYMCDDHVCIKPIRVFATASEAKSRWLVVMVKVRFNLVDLLGSPRQGCQMDAALIAAPSLAWRVRYNCKSERAKPDSPWTITFAPAVTVLCSGGSLGSFAYHRTKQVELPANTVVVAHEVVESEMQAGVDEQCAPLSVKRDREFQFAPNVESN
jgi:hypothetical protein